MKKKATLPQPRSVAEAFGGVPLGLTTLGEDGSTIGTATSFTVQEAMQLCGLDWETLVCPACLSNKARTKIPGLFCTFRRAGPGDDMPLGTVRGRYRVRQNRDSFAFIDRVLHHNLQASIVAGGMLHGGVRTWVAVNLGTFDVGSERIIRIMVVLNSHDGQSPWTVHFIPVLLGQFLALNYHDTAGAYRIRHTKSADLRMQEIEKILQVGDHGLKGFEKTCRAMAKRKLSAEAAYHLVLRCLGEPVPTCIESDIVLKTQPGYRAPQWVHQSLQVCRLLPNAPTVWDVYRAFVQYCDQVRTVRGTEARPDNVHESRMFGYSAKQKHQALLECCKMASK